MTDTSEAQGQALAPTTGSDWRFCRVGLASAAVHYTIAVNAYAAKGDEKTAAALEIASRALEKAAEAHTRMSQPNAAGEPRA